MQPLSFTLHSPFYTRLFSWQLQDDAIAHDGERLKTTEANVRQLQRHFEADTVPWIQKLRQKEQELQRRLLHVSCLSALVSLSERGPDGS